MNIILELKIKRFVQDQGAITFKFRYELVDDQSPRTVVSSDTDSKKIEELQKAKDEKQVNDAVRKILEAEKN
jgi:hypothetical protein